MKIKISIVFVLLFICCTQPSKSPKSSSDLLSNLRDFEVFVFFPSYDKPDSTLVYDTLQNCFQNMGSVVALEKTFLVRSLLQSPSSYPQAIFTIVKMPEQLEVNCKLFAEVEMVSNRYKLACPVWEKSLAIFQDLDQPDVKIAGMIKEIVGAFSKDYKEANLSQSKPSFCLYKTSAF